jgi:hypothetical protein
MPGPASFGHSGFSLCLLRAQERNKVLFRLVDGWTTKVQAAGRPK